jgi:UDP-N-acetylglucosamine--N-acetylmuramyl-(pentapeptide) pyrophosphoryl-undecaprenol N-acetylglucosamine transferase
MGGYSSFPAVFIASLFGKVLPVRTVIHEQNALAGLTNRFLGHFVDKVLVSYPQTRSQFSSARKVVVTGNPIRSEFFLARRTPETYNRFNLYPDKKTVLIFGGSNGSSALTSAVRHEALEISKRTDIQVLLVTGRDQDTSTLELEFAAAGIKNIAVKTYIKSMGEAFAIADLVVSRAGASSLAEITSCGKPSILIPWKEAADGHQEANAQVLKVSNACEIMDESELGNHQLAQLIEEMVQDKEGLRLMARRAVYMGAKHAAASMLGEIVGLVEGAKT